MDSSTKQKVLDLKNRIEASIIIWKRKLHHKDVRHSWGSSVILEKRELFKVRAETILILLKQRFPRLPQYSLDISKIQYNRDIGQAIQESYSRILESLAFTVMSRIEDVLYAYFLIQISSPVRSEASSSSSSEDAVTVSAILSDFMGWVEEGEQEGVKERGKGMQQVGDEFPHYIPLVGNKEVVRDALIGMPLSSSSSSRLLELLGSGCLRDWSSLFYLESKVVSSCLGQLGQHGMGVRVEQGVVSKWEHEWRLLGCGANVGGMSGALTFCKK
ncbi:Rop guanine nucleotide exchange factor 9 [Hibiscus syriacus]|uniref:Rop guanine nucleotide exchange factor 9 n=1 Tax=Hibiscus syriacus TaxID=106335 RepID=A0A6A2X234_HIBSY|nr:Rop guanine nucleotide exchange factor 9 [Hibiscus syriacus]